jgi:hypothetical protein
MPKPIHELSPFVYSELRKYIRLKTSLLIHTKTECERLSSQIKDQTQILISASTLYRIFIAEENSKPYLNTLNGLSVFCGFKDWYEFENHVNELARFDFSYGKIHINEKPVSSFIKICVHNNQLDVLYQYASQFPEEIDFEKKIRIGYELYQSLLDNPNSNLAFFDKFSGLPLIRGAFFEYMADPDFKIKDYEYGLKCYLKYCEPAVKLNDYRDVIFAKSMLFRHYYISGHIDNANQLGKELYQTGIKKKFDFDSLYIFPKFRFLAYQLFYKHLNADNDSVLAYKQYLLEYCENNISNWSSFEQSVAFYNVAEVFSITKANKSTVEHLKKIFQELLSKLPKSKINKSLDKLLPYFQENGLIKLKYMNEE